MNKFYQIVILILFILTIFFAERQQRIDIKRRVLKMNKECYTKQDLELIIFGKS